MQQLNLLFLQIYKIDFEKKTWYILTSHVCKEGMIKIA